MNRYIVDAWYCTKKGNPAFVRRTVTAENHDEALAHMAARVRVFKRYGGKLDMNCVEV